MTKDELDELAEQADPGLLPGCVVPAVENPDQPVRVPGARKAGTTVGVWQQQVKRWGCELQQRFVRGHGIVLNVDCAQDAAVAVPEFRRLQQVKASGNRVETVAAAPVGPMSPGRLGVPVQADAYLDPQALERGEHRTVQQRAVSLQGHVHLGGHGGAEHADQVGQPLRSCEQRLTAVQDDVDARQVVPVRVLGDPRDGLVGHRSAHSLGQRPPALIRHFIHIAVRTRQIAATMNF
jgi:hypothetical protein